MPSVLEANDAPEEVKRWKSQIKELLALADAGKSGNFMADPTAYCGTRISRYGILRKWHALVEKQYPAEEIPTAEQLWKIASDFPAALQGNLDGQPKTVANWAPQLKKLLSLRDAKKNVEISTLMPTLISQSGSVDSPSNEGSAAVKEPNAVSSKDASPVSAQPTQTAQPAQATNQRSKSDSEERASSPRFGSDNRANSEKSEYRNPFYNVVSKKDTTPASKAPSQVEKPQKKTVRASEFIESTTSPDAPHGVDTSSSFAMSGDVSSGENSVSSHARSAKSAEEEPENNARAVFEEQVQSNLPRPEDVRSYYVTDFHSITTLDEPEPIEGASLSDSLQDDGTVLLEWELPEADDDKTKVRLFRVVNDDRVLERDPEDGYLKGVTVGHSWLDTESHNGALTMYQVWVHEGKTEKEALLSEPQLVGETFIIHPVTNFTLSAIGQEITGQWDFVEPTDRVCVYTCADGRNVLHKRNEICTETPNYRGFRWQSTQGGVTHRFVVVRIVDIRGTRLASKPSEEQHVLVDAEVSAIDISVQEVEGFDSTEFEVTWNQPPAGEVRIYRTQQEPPPDITCLDSIELSGLQRTLDDQDWQNNIEGTDHGCTVAWPRDWYSIVLTPVHVDGQICRVGKPHAFKRVGEASNIELHERVTHQLLTFGWPHGASRVTAFYQESPEDCGGELPEPSDLVSIEPKEYEKRGGMILDPPLPARGTVILEPAAIYERKLVKGPRSEVEYRGCMRMEYDILPVPQQPGMFQIKIHSNRDILGENWHFTLLAQHSRLPLEKADGERVEVTRWQDGRPEGGTQQGLFTSILVSPEKYPPVFWTFNLDALQSYKPNSFLRVFPDQLFDSKGQSVALVDPPIQKLYLGHLRQLAEQMKNSPGR